nr:monovalent cation/H+ antiporter complex subunit F [Pseudonocardia acidicola]
MVPALVTASRGETVDRLAGLCLAGTVTTLVVMVLAVGYGRPSYLGVALVLAALNTTGTLVFTRTVVRR